MEKKSIKVTTKVLRDIISEGIKKALSEGIDVDEYTYTVSYNPYHENNVETSEITNPIMVKKYADNVEVWSIFKRKVGDSDDGNPLIYAMKGEGGWRFATNKDKNAIYAQIEKIANKFFDKYSSDVTIVIPSQGVLNRLIYDIAKKRNSTSLFVDDILLKLTVTEVMDMIKNPNSLFRQIYPDRFSFINAINELKRYTSKMGTYFRSHFVANMEMRNAIEYTIRVEEENVSKYMDAINGKNILLLDDNVGFGSTIKQTCKLLREIYSPNSITMLTLFSEKYNSDGSIIKRKKKKIRRRK